MHITWIGHSCFKIEKDGFTVIMDPYKDGSVPGLKNIRETADLVICSHEHGDHSGRECVQITGKTDSPFTVSQISTFHDNVQGMQRGESKITILDDGSERIAHFGDLGCGLTSEQEKQLAGLDLVLVPVGGYYTIDGNTAAVIMKNIRPKRIIPMHYRDDEKKFGYDVISTVDPFIQNFDQMKFLHKSELNTVDDYREQVIVLEPKNI